MIGLLRGNIQRKSDQFLLLDVNGVGYKVFTTEHVLQNHENFAEIELNIHTHVTEQDISLYGFESEEELAMFEMLISVSGVGPKSGIAILKTSYEDVQKAILTEDLHMLQSFPGIGRKTAERIIVDLKSKIADLGVEVQFTKKGEVPDELISALTQLGFTQQEAIQKLKKVDLSKTDEEIIKQALSL